MSLDVSKLDGRKICKYLQLKHWQDKGALYSGRVMQMLSPDSMTAVLIPLVNTFSDYDEVMHKALKIIASTENISIIYLYSKLVNPSYDFLRWRIAADSTLGGIIPFNSMGANIDFIKNMLGTACLDILNPAVFHAKVYTNEVNEQISQYRFGQTEIGSYILNILCPLGFYQYQLFDSQTESLPLSRRINLNILGNIAMIQQSAEEKSGELDDRVDAKVLSVNFLTSLTDIYEENKDSQITLSVDWNSDVPLIDNQQPVSNVLLKPKYMDRVMETVEKHMPLGQQNVPATYYGKITNIGTKPNVEDRTSFDIKIATIGENLHTIYVIATLNYTQYYQIADKALLHGENIKVSGIKTATAKSTKLREATIEVLDKA